MRNLLLLTISFFSLSLMFVEAVEAASRLGGGGNRGLQRSAPAQQQATPKAPAQNQQQQAVPATPAPQPQPSGFSKWLGPLAGLALGAGLAALFFNNGLGGLLMGMLVVGLLVAALVFVARFLMRGRTAEGPMQYAGAGAAGPAPLTALPGGAGAQSVASATSRWPAGFNEAEFVRHARLNFVSLQEAHDKQDLSTMRDFLAPALYREIEADIRAAGAVPQKTEVLTLEAEVLDVADENGSYIVSVRFSGAIREAAGREAEPFSETWHLQKPLAGRSGWMLAGIQQS